MNDSSRNSRHRASALAPRIIAPIASSVRTRRVVALSHIGFLFVGIANTLLGPVLPLLSERWKLNDTQGGYLFTAQFTGAIAGSALSGALMKKLGVMPVLAAGYGGLAVATATLAFSPWLAGVIAIATLGFSLGLTNPATNLLISELNSERRAAALNLLNLVWGAGAIACPLLISTLANGGNASRPLGALASALAIVALSLGFSHRPSLPVKSDESTMRAESTLRARLNSFVLLTGVLIFMYVGTEAAVGGWIAAYAQRLGATAQSYWALTPSLFYAGLLTGRAAASVFLRRISETRLIFFSLIGAVGGILVIILGEGLLTISIGAGLAGFGLAAVFPTTFAIFTQRCGAEATRIAGMLFVLASLGGAVIPWLVGWSSDFYGNLRIGLIVPLLGSLLMIALQGAIILDFSFTRRRV
jgi:MFS transporter, FHS family, glucose/mannose:H+ symporter